MVRRKHEDPEQPARSDRAVLRSPISAELPSPRGPVGLLAGRGRFPIAFAEKARRLGIPVVCLGIRHEASPELIPLVERFYWTGVAQLGRMIRSFRRKAFDKRSWPAR